MEINIQYAHHRHEESESKYDVSPANVLDVFDKFDWPEQVQKASELQQVSPTMAVINKAGENMVWVSAMGDSKKQTFIAESFYPGEVSKLFGLIKKQGTVQLASQQLSKEQAREIIKCFASGEYEALKSIYA